MGVDRPTVLLTRPERASRRFAVLLDRELEGRATILVSPALEIVTVAFGGPFDQYQTLIFTSENGVLSFARSVPGDGRTAYCVGDRTAEAARAAGYHAVSAAGDAVALRTRLVADTPPGPWLHPGGAERSADLAGDLTRSGFPTDAVVTYRQVRRPLDADACDALGRGAAILPVFSPRSAAILSEALPPDSIPPRVVAISQASADAWTGPARSFRIAPTPDAPSMAAAIRAELDSDSPC